MLFDVICLFYIKAAQQHILIIQENSQWTKLYN